MRWVGFPRFFAILLFGCIPGWSTAGLFCTVQTPITVGSTVTGTLTDSCTLLVRDPDGVQRTYPAVEYALDATAGQQIAAALSSTAFDTYLYLFAPDNSYWQNDDGGGGLNSRIPPTSGYLTLNQGGRYVVLVSSAYSINSSQPHGGAFALALTGPAPAPPPTPTTQTVWEFYNSGLKHYFITASSAEASNIDAGGAGPGWSRTGLTFQSYPTTGAPANSATVCRFYGTPGIGPNSHFYTASATECNNVRSDPGWTYEGPVFNMMLPVSSGTCASPLLPVYRAYNLRFAQNDSNHRYTADLAAYQQTVASGWAGEGVVMCTPGTGGSGTTSDRASATVSTNSAPTTISTGTGARVIIPTGAVAPKPDGTPGTVTVTLARDPSATPTPPAGFTMVSDVYQLTPSGQYFQEGVSVTLPVTAGNVSGNVSMLRFNADGTSTSLGGEYDPVSRSVTAQTNHFTGFGLAMWNNNSTADGCVTLDNSTAPVFSWKNACVNQVLALTYPSQIPANYQYGTATVSPDPCSSGWCNQVRWFLPQGRYEVCVEEWKRNNQLDTPRLTGSVILPNAVNILQPWINTNGLNPACPGGSLNVGVLSSLGTVSTSGCACMGNATSGGTTGQVVVSLVWHAPTGTSNTVDLDLHVTDPRGEEIYYNHPTSASGGKLDFDNKCSGYREGRPENIYWTTAPSGNYKVEVVYFDSCGNSPPASQAFTVNITVNGATSAYNGAIATATARAKVLVTNFSLP